MAPHGNIVMEEFVWAMFLRDRNLALLEFTLEGGQPVYCNGDCCDVATGVGEAVAATGTLRRSPAR